MSSLKINKFKKVLEKSDNTSLNQGLKINIFYPLNITDHTPPI
jgi:hypothetical protein